MAAIKVFAAALSLVCMYITVSEANNVYYPAPQYGWAPWSKWCECTKKCGGGEQWRTRKCLSPQITPYSPYTIYTCKGAKKETRKCNVYQCPINGGYGSYGPYGKCSKSCGGGYQTCYRKCNKPVPQYGGKPCSGSNSKTRPCNVDVKCPINGGYGSYGPYGKCSKTCGGGYQTCYRKCNHPAPQYGGKPCSGPAKRTKACNVDVKCPINGGYGSYGPYGKCSKTCGGGYQTCYRKCNNPAPQYGGKPCSGPAKRTKACNVDVKCPINGGYGPYGPYGKCSKSCGGGYQTCYRKCNKPAPQYGGKPCSGSDSRTRACNVNVQCPVYLGFVKSVYRVSETAGKVVIQVKRTGDLTKSTSARIEKDGGTASAQDHGNVDRDIVFAPGASTLDVSIDIIDDNLMEKAEHFTVKLSSTDAAVASVQPDKTRVIIIDNDVDGGWGPWTKWSKCDKPCGTGSQSRSRQCNNPAPRGGGKPCSGPSTQKQKCYIKQYCAVDGGYGSYGPYGKCSKTCGGGYQTCYRKCNKPAPQYGGKPCSGPDSKTRACNVKVHCPIHGGYGSYGPYGKCSKTCGGGYQTCYRKCNSPAPLYGGKPCSGPDSRTRACNVKVHCPIHGGYGSYGPYGKCSKTCGGGYQTCYRKCDNPAPLYGGNPCSGPASRTRACNVKVHCPIHGGYGSYGPYGKCSKTCGGGYQTCYRKCDNPAPLYGGNPCSGPASRTRACNVKVHCPIHGGYGSYGPYGKCSKTCGGGYQTCYRKCDNPAPLYGGNPCSGPASRTRACNVNVHCPVHGGYGSYGPYGTCSKTCGGGYQTCYRKCDNPAPLYGGNPCSGPASRTRACNVDVHCPVDGKWSDWGPFGPCSHTCGGGTQSRSRTCTNPAPAYGGKDCAGPKTETRKCNEKERCPAKIGFKIASQTVKENVGTFQVEIIRTGGEAFQHSVSVMSNDGSAVSSGQKDFNAVPATNIVFAANDASSKFVDVTVIDDSLDEQDEDFNLQLSTTDDKVTLTTDKHTITIEDNDVDGGWGPWSKWSKCSHLCGTGSQPRSRQCNNPAPQGGGKPCSGPATQKQKCYIKRYCAINAGWSSWSPYGKCSKPCGGGVCYRTRTCDNPAPQYGGKGCDGPSKSSKSCNSECCKVNGGYGAWSKWSPCSITCRATPYAVGHQKRTRKCNKPYPACHGAKCYGPEYETKSCTPYAACPVYTPPPPAY